MGIFDWLRPSARTKKAHDTPQVRELVERVIRLSPQLELAQRCRARLAPALKISLDYVSGIVASLPAPHEASAAAWSNDPCIHAFFAAPDDVAHALSRSPDLHAWFDRHPLAQEAYAVLGMAMSERRGFGVEQHGDTVRSDVARVTLSFDDHQVRVCGETDADLRQQIVRRVVEQIALEGLARVSADEFRRDALEQERALLRTRLQLLVRQGAGTREMVGERGFDTVAELAHVQTLIDENDRQRAALGLKTEALERELDVVCEALAHPSDHAHVETKRVHLDRMNVVLTGERAQQVPEIEFSLARVPDNPQGLRAFSLVRFARANLLDAPGTIGRGDSLVI